MYFNRFFKKMYINLKKIEIINVKFNSYCQELIFYIISKCIGISRISALNIFIFRKKEES